MLHNRLACRGTAWESSAAVSARSQRCKYVRESGESRCYTNCVRPFAAVAFTLAAVSLCSGLHGQDLEPRAYSNSPTGLNFAIAGYGYAKGSVLTDPALPLENVTNDTHVGVFAYATTLNVLG